MSPIWHHKVYGLHPLKVAYQDGKLTFEQSRDQQVAILKASPAYSMGEFADLVDELAETLDESDFDEALDVLYDVCDRERIWLDPIS